MNKRAVLGLMKDKGIDLIFVGNLAISDPSFFYLSEVKKGAFENAVLIFWKTGKRAILMSQLEEGLIKSRPGYEIVIYGSRKNADANKILDQLMRKAKRIGMDKTYFNAAGFESLKKRTSKKNQKIVEIGRELTNLRIIKTEGEIARISKACKIASRVAREIPDFAKAGMTERAIAAEIEKRMKVYGADGFAFPTIVASGPNSAIPHYRVGDRRLRKGDFVVIDFGCKFQNYCSDMTRTFVIGSPSKKQIDMYQTCLSAQLECIKMTKEGAAFGTIDKKANEITKKYGPPLHAIGHGIGVGIHEGPRQKEAVLKKNMVLTIEPGIYIRKFGGVRIEDDILVTKTGCRVLTSAPKELVQI